MSFINEIYLRTGSSLHMDTRRWVALRLWEAWGGRMASDASCKCSSFIPSHHACSNFLERELLDRQSCYSIILQSQLHRQKDYSRQPITHHTPRGPGADHETGK